MLYTRRAHLRHTFIFMSHSMSRPSTVWPSELYRGDTLQVYRHPARIQNPTGIQHPEYAVYACIAIYIYIYIYILYMQYMWLHQATRYLRLACIANSVRWSGYRGCMSRSQSLPPRGTVTVVVVHTGISPTGYNSRSDPVRPPNYIYI